MREQNIHIFFDEDYEWNSENAVTDILEDIDGVSSAVVVRVYSTGEKTAAEVSARINYDSDKITDIEYAVSTLSEVHNAVLRTHK